MKSRDQIKDELLVLRCQARDSQAFEELVDRWQQRLWRHARLLTGEDDAAWDVVQETWVAIVRGIPRLQDTAAFPRWVYSILNGRCVDWIRRQQRQRRLSESLEIESRASEPTDEYDALRAAMDNLPTEERAILSLRYTEQYSTDEIAEILGIPEGTVKSRLYSAREKLRQLMERS